MAALFVAGGALLPAPAPAARSLEGSVQILARGGKILDKAADPRWAVISFRPQTPVRGLQTSQTFVLATRKKEFVPRVLVVPVGATVAFPNEDPILHNVFSVSGANSFDLGLYRKGPGKTAKFEQAGMVRVFCNVHQSMVAYIAVVETPFHAHPDASGAFRLSIPDGAGTLEVWHEQTDPVTVAIPAGALARVLGAPLVVRPVVVRPRLPTHLNKVGRPYDRSRQGDYN